MAPAVGRTSSLAQTPAGCVRRTENSLERRQPRTDPHADPLSTLDDRPCRARGRGSLLETGSVGLLPRKLDIEFMPAKTDMHSCGINMLDGVIGRRNRRLLD